MSLQSALAFFGIGNGADDDTLAQGKRRTGAWARTPPQALCRTLTTAPATPPPLRRDMAVLHRVLRVHWRRGGPGLGEERD